MILTLWPYVESDLLLGHHKTSDRPAVRVLIRCIHLLLIGSGFIGIFVPLVDTSCCPGWVDWARLGVGHEAESTSPTAAAMVCSVFVSLIPGLKST